MGLFRTAGRQVEQFKQRVTESAEDAESDDGETNGDPTYECESCGARFDSHEEECPECWSSEISKLGE